MVEELTPRQQMILELVVREFVQTGVPVASKTLVEKYGLDISPATVRNEMARLEELGYLTHPHTSAGRQPTNEGYRYFVERLLRETELPPEERRTIAHQFQQVQTDVEEWMPLAASVLARTTRGAALVTAPQAAQPRYRHLQLISVQGRLVLLVLVLQGGVVRQQMLTFPEPLPQAVLSEAADRLNQLCAGLTADEIEPRIGSLPLLEADVARLVVEMMRRAAGTPEEIYHNGLAELLQEPEFQEAPHAQGVLRVIEERSYLEAILAYALGTSVGSVRVIIGGEGRFDELRACSLVLSRYGVAGLATGALGVLGPTRMGYGRAISAVRFVSGILSKLVYDVFVAEAEPFLSGGVRGLPLLPERESLPSQDAQDPSPN
ncbi:MAG: heat-inducible transcriptional repressor HrcA [Anaerolineae bacterium]|nr:heat-inducible transcriptional repressor HrcA [Anaerolineae bacterium]MCX8068283.1 heat-inducible transcriptional repressor HrcA [Anaerolineae bacterium]MDW7990674.1 heat-inducible transcriptional repressor HrcA [Anaerolineae bacterium]